MFFRFTDPEMGKKNFKERKFEDFFSRISMAAVIVIGSADIDRFSLQQSFFLTSLDTR